MSVKEFIRFLLAPGFIAGTLVQNTDFSFRSFNHGETVWIIAMIAAFIGYMAYLYEVDRLERLAEMKAEALKEAERLRKEHEAWLVSEENRYRWERDFDKIMSWRDQITGCGNLREVSPWQE